MNSTSIIYNNSIYELDDFVNQILFTDYNKKIIPSCEIQECKDFYSIKINSYLKDIHVFEIYYKNSFLIIQIKLRDDKKHILSTRMFFLPNINTNKMSHSYLKNSAILKIPKIYCDSINF